MRWIDRWRGRRWSQLAVVNLRILLGFAFLPAGLKKVLGQPFTDPGNSGSFHEFLHAFYATGVFYPFVGAVQLAIAFLLMTQTYATLGAVMALPVITSIAVFCWSTGVVPTAVVVTFMLAGNLVLLLWDADRWIGILRPNRLERTASATLSRPGAPVPSALIDLALWRLCGFAILAFYGLTCLLHGGVYRPRGLDFRSPEFYALPIIALFPVVTLILERRRRKRAAGRPTGSE
ncbi:MAG: hypothetical protein AAF481_02380 [Acidobacteriota bacterium]